MVAATCRQAKRAPLLLSLEGRPGAGRLLGGALGLVQATAASVGSASGPTEPGDTGGGGVTPRDEAKKKRFKEGHRDP